MTFFVKPRRKSISFKLLLYILSFSTVITVIITAINVYTDYSVEMNLIDERIERIGKTNLKSLSNSLWYMDRNYAQTQLNGLLQFPDVQYVKITSKVKQNNIFAGVFQTESTIAYEFPLTYEADAIVYDLGVFHIGMNLNNVHRRIFNKILIILLTQALKTFIVSGFIFLIVQWLITRHLETIANFVRQMDIDALAQELQLNQPDKIPDELTQVAGAINLMRGELDQRIQSLKKSENRYRTLVENAPIVILHLLPSGEIMDLNPEAELLYGEKRREILGQSYVEKTFAKEIHSKIIGDMDKLARGDTVTTYDAPFINRDGAEHHLFWNLSRFFDDQKNVSGIMAIGLDITERKRLESQLQQAQKMESVGRLAGGVAHDSNNMISIILGNAEMLLEDLGADHPSFSGVKEIKKAAERSANLTRQLLAFARKQTISPKTVNLNEAIQGILKMLGRLIGEDIELLWCPNENLWPVKIDPSQIDQLLANLCVNSRDAIKNVGRITIETDNTHFDEGYCKIHQDFKPGDYVLTAVSDNGFGMDREILENLFEPFFTTKKMGEGTGLGLATVYGIIKQNNGFIHVYSEPGQGTTFKMYFPRHRDSAGKKPVMVKEKTQKGVETILLVEDEEPILKVTQTMLERLGYNVLPANTPDEAIRISRDTGTKIHLLMTDVVMPSMNGRQLSEKILSIVPSIKCLYTSGYTANVIARRGVLDKGLNFINKPFSSRTLSSKIREILDEE